MGRPIHTCHGTTYTATVARFRPLTRVSVGIKQKVENKYQYQEYLDELKSLREELGVNLKEDLYPEGSDSPHHNP